MNTLNPTPSEILDKYNIPYFSVISQKIDQFIQVSLGCGVYPYNLENSTLLSSYYPTMVNKYTPNHDPNSSIIEYMKILTYAVPEFRRLSEFLFHYCIVNGLTLALYASRNEFLIGIVKSSFCSPGYVDHVVSYPVNMPLNSILDAYIEGTNGTVLRLPITDNYSIVNLSLADPPNFQLQSTPSWGGQPFTTWIEDSVPALPPGISSPYLI